MKTLLATINRNVPAILAVMASICALNLAVLFWLSSDSGKTVSPQQLAQQTDACVVSEIREHLSETPRGYPVGVKRAVTSITEGQLHGIHEYCETRIAADLIEIKARATIASQLAAVGKS